MMPASGLAFEERHMRPIACLRLLIWLAIPASRSAAASPIVPKFNYTVGSDLCDFATVSAAIEAIVANPSGTHRIFVARDVAAPTATIAINNLDVAITGGFQNCADLVAPSVNTTISGTQNRGDSVFTITGTSNVTLDHLTISGGHAGSFGVGGGVNFKANGSLELSNVTVSNNTAPYGGGIFFAGINGPAELQLDAYTIIQFNTAKLSGGGISLSGNAHMSMLEDFTYVAFNTANFGDGGGVSITGPATADIGSPGYVDAAVINSNTAVFGGGISIESGISDEQNAVLRMFSTDAARPVRISSNTARSAGSNPASGGGGIYVKGYYDGDTSSGRAYLCASGFRIDGNAAVEGAAIYMGSVDESSFSDTNVALDAFYNNLCGPVPPPRLVRCVDASCNMIDGNEAIDINNDDQPTDGAIVFGMTDSAFHAGRTKFLANSGGYLLNISGDPGLGECLIAENHTEHELILHAPLGGSYYLFIDSSTIANNTIGAQYVIYTAATSLTNSIFAETIQTLHYNGGVADLAAYNLMSNDLTTFPVNPTIVKDDPVFVDAAHGNYHLLATSLHGTEASPAIDFALPDANDSGSNGDIDGRPRNQDVPEISNRFGTRDLGAYEMQPITDRIFADSFGDPISIVY